MLASDSATLCGPTATTGFSHCTLLFAARETITVPLPVPEPPETSVSSGPSSCTFHGHPAGAVTAICACPPVSGTFPLAEAA